MRNLKIIVLTLTISSVTALPLYADTQKSYIGVGLEGQIITSGEGSGSNSGGVSSRPESSRGDSGTDKEVVSKPTEDKTGKEDLNLDIGLTDKEIKELIDKIPFTLPIGKFNISENLKLGGKYTSIPTVNIKKGIQNIEITHKNKIIAFDVEGVNPTGIEKTYKDIPANHWAVGSITKSTKSGFLVGVDGDNFSPKSTLNYGDSYTAINRVVMRAKDISMSSSRKLIEDLNNIRKNHWAYYNTASILTKIGESNAKKLTVGKGDLYKSPITRDELAETLYNLSLKKNPPLKNSNIKYLDITTVPRHIEWCGKTGLMVGDNLGNFNPNQTLNRAELSTVLIRLSEILEGKDLNIIQSVMVLEKPSK